NLILRLGKYGNIDDKGIALAYAPYLATHSDKRLFIADTGNSQIISVKLNHHTEVILKIK
ncbi:MAG: hypothetical protein COA79_26140, partial [Planctomycetota bacterium]